MKRPPKELWSVQELALRLDRSPKTILRWLRKNDIPTEQMGAEVCVWLSELYARKPQLFDSARIAADLASAID